MDEFAFVGENASAACEIEAVHAPHAMDEDRFCLGHSGALAGGVELVIVVTEIEVGKPGYADRAEGYSFVRPATGGMTWYVDEE